MDISKDIKEAIKKNLPMEIGEVLKERIELVESLEKKVKSQADNIEKQKETISTKDKIISNLENSISDVGNAKDIYDKAKKLSENTEKQKRDMEITLLKKQLELKDLQAYDYKTFMLNMSRNLDFRKSFNGNIAGSYVPTEKDQYGNVVTRGYHDSPYVTQETTKTIE